MIIPYLVSRSNDDKIKTWQVVCIHELFSKTWFLPCFYLCFVYSTPKTKPPSDLKGVDIGGADDDLLSHGRTTLSLAYCCFTSEFGKGSGGTNKL